MCVANCLTPVALAGIMFRMNQRQSKFVKNRARGMDREKSAILAGYPAGQDAGKQVESYPSVQDELAKIRAEMAKSAGVSKDDVVQLLLDAVALAKLQADPQGIVAAAKELARMLGFNAPEVKKVTHGIDKKDLKQALRELSEDQLYQLAYGGQTIEGEAKRLPDGPTDTTDTTVTN